jgi:hypothetical protein
METVSVAEKQGLDAGSQLPDEHVPAMVDGAGS